MKEKIKVWWYLWLFTLTGWVSHVFMRVARAVAAFRSHILPKAQDKVPAPPGCPDYCRDRMISSDNPRYKPTEWIERNGQPFPIWRVASLRFPLSHLHWHLGGLKISSWIEIMQLLPKDAKVVDARHGYDYGNTIDLLIESMEFPEVPESANYPRIMLTTACRVLNDEQATTAGYKVEQYYNGYTIRL